MGRSLREILQSVSDVLFPEQLGEAEVNIDSKDLNGDTPLHVLVWRNDNDGVDILIKSGADVNGVGDMGETPLHIAISRGNEHVIESLIKAGAKLTIRSEFNETALEKARKKGGKIQKIVHKYISI